MKADENVRAFLKAAASKGGKARAKKLTKPNMTTIADKGVLARWGTRMHSYMDWRIAVRLDKDDGGRPRATVRLYDSETRPRGPASGLAICNPLNGNTDEEAENKAVARAKEWINRQPVDHPRGSKRTK